MNKNNYTLSMITTVSIIILPGEETNEALIRSKIALHSGIEEESINAIVCTKKSIDARRGQVKLNMRYTVYIGEEPPKEPSGGPLSPPKWQQSNPKKRVVIIGSGPAGLFAALRLLEDGITPIIIERGPQTGERKIDIANIPRDQKVNPESNYCFGEGGAGTFSDGKLYTRSNKRGDISRILGIFNYHGANPEILTDAHPHIGTDKLPSIINKIRETILACGGEFYFNTRCTNIHASSGQVTGISISVKNSLQEEIITADTILLATGHSARDIYEILAKYPGSLEPKTFAMGVRVEHPRQIIDEIQYHGQKNALQLPAATYRLSTQVEERGVYSFCMCPGGLIVPSATADEEIVLNGMSPSSRNTRWSNAAIVVEIKPVDIPAIYRTGATAEEKNLAGIRYQKALELAAKKNGKGQSSPAQRLPDFIDGIESKTLPECSYSPGVVSSRIDQWLPEQITGRLQEAFIDFNRYMRGFITPEALVVGVETRTSSPIRITRNPDTFECVALKGLYVAGEGSGYAGGIVSSAMDGENCAGAICSKFGKTT